jgi:hypothetical protein
MRRIKLIPIIGISAMCFLYTQANASGQIRTVMVVGNEICMQSGNGARVFLTHDGVPKALPVLSKNGKNSAFIESAASNFALAKLIVVDSTGKSIANIPVHPFSPTEVYSGMRFVNALEWLTNDRLAVSGSINPHHNKSPNDKYMKLR